MIIQKLPSQGDEFARWELALEKYEEILEANIREAIDLMSPDDLRKYAKKFNLPACEKEDVLLSKFSVNHFNARLTAASGQSELFKRLISGRKSLEFPPPRSFGKPWYQLFDADDEQQCIFSVRGLSLRERDSSKSQWVVLINECPWEVCNADKKQQEFLEVAYRQDKETLAEMISTGVECQVKFGRWPAVWSVQLASIEPIASSPVTFSGTISRLR